MLDLKGKVVLVTGGSRGIGRAIALGFVEAGASVMTCSRKPPEDTTLPWIEADVREPEQVDRLVRETLDRHGRLDVLVNNAGGSPPVPSATASPRFSLSVITLNLVAPLLCAQRANAAMQEQADGGVIINVASVAGMRPAPGTAAYGAAKAGLLNLTQTLAVEWAPRVRVNAVTPGLVATEAARTYYVDHPNIAAGVPLGRLGEPRDVADACLFLASPMARFVSGANLVVHGGGER